MAGVFLWLSLILIQAFVTCVTILTVCPLGRRDGIAQQRYQLNSNGYPQLSRDLVRLLADSMPTESILAEISSVSRMLRVLPDGGRWVDGVC